MSSTPSFSWACIDSRNSDSMAYKLYSLWSSSRSFLGPVCNICRHSSAPILPPAPLTKTILSRLFFSINAWSGITGSRPNKSSGSNSLISRTVIRPWAKSTKSGSERTCTWYWRRSAKISLRFARPIDGIANKMSVTPWVSIKRPISLGAYTIKPLIVLPWYCDPSSKYPAKKYWPDWRKAEAICMPECPAP